MHTTLISVADIPTPIPPQWVFVDCRFSLQDEEAGRAEYLVGHISGAHYAHLNDDLSGDILPGVTGRHPLPSVGKFSSLVGSWGIGPATQVLIYDQGQGGVAARLWWMLNWIGHEQVAVINGGWPAYASSNRPIDAKIPKKRTGCYPARVDDSMLVDRREVSDRLENDPNFILLDARDAQRHQGLVEPIDPVAGHIPGSISRPFKDNLSQEGSHWHTDEILAARWHDILSQEASNVAVYCGSGVTACHNILSIRHVGGPMVKLYPGSWSEWITQEIG